MTAAGKEESARTAELEASREAVMAALKSLLEAKEHFARAAEAAGLDLKHEAVDQLHKGRDKAEAVGAEVEKHLQDKPLQTLAMAFAGGFLLSLLLGRR